MWVCSVVSPEERSRSKMTGFDALELVISDHCPTKEMRELTSDHRHLPVL